jgi:DNA repair protein SbcD/Mre11
MPKFIHAADVHLDSPLRGLERYDGAPVEEIRHASRRALENLVRLAEDEAVDFVLIAGDLYDGDWKDANTGLFFIQQIARLREAKIPVFLIAGNHDAANRMTRTLRQPDNVRILSHQAPETVHLEDCGVAIHGQSFATQRVSDNLALSYPERAGGFFNIGLLHTCATGREGHESYAPCSLDDLRLREYDYWALGHVHNRELLLEDPCIVFPGNLQGRHIRETGPKGCMLVRADVGVQSEFRPLDVFRWEWCHVDTNGTRTEDEVLERLCTQLEKLRDSAEDRPLAVRLKISGDTVDRLRARPESWRDECRAAGNDVGQGVIWIEKIVFDTSARGTAGRREVGDGPLGELFELLGELRGNDEVLQELSRELDDLKRKLPRELREGPEAIDLDNPDMLREILTEAGELLTHRLLPKEGAR